MTTTIIGIDPGLVDTGVVKLHFTDAGVTTEHQVFTSTLKDDEYIVDIAGIASYVKVHPKAHVFMEAYRPRGTSYGTNPKMQELMQQLRGALPKAKVIDNTGVKFIVGQALMELLGVWTFGTTTHHQDLRSAARIGLYGALKNDELNRVVYDAVLVLMKED